MNMKKKELGQYPAILNTWSITIHIIVILINLVFDFLS